MRDDGKNCDGRIKNFHPRQRSRRGYTKRLDGIHAREDFLSKIDNNEFLEWAEFSGNMYGTQKEYVQSKLAQGKNLILEIDTKGALNVKKIMPEANLIFILPPSFEELEARLRGRHTETEEAIQKRLESTRLEMENSKLFDYQIVNDSIENAVCALEKIML